MRRDEFTLESSSDTMVPALVVVPDGGTFNFWPQPLPDVEVRTMLDTVEVALTSAAGLTGHQGLEIGHAYHSELEEPSS
jgi:hypothetical protein